MSAPKPERPMTVPAHHVARLRELVAEWERALAARDFAGIDRTGAFLVGTVEALLEQHDAGAKS